MTDLISKRSDRIHNIITQHLQPSVLHIENESHLHRPRPDSETHFKLTVVSSQFSGVSKLERHRMINQLLTPELKTGLHAYSLMLYSIEEWEKNPAPISSPMCQHNK